MGNSIELIQKKELDILKEFIRVCQNYNLTYYALGGTLLGAVRHGGFIPWDDDIDIGMPREDYEKLKRLGASGVFRSPYFCINSDSDRSYTQAFMKLQDTSTSITMTYSNIEQAESLWIDIFPIDGMPGGWLKKRIQEKRYLFSRMMVQLSQFNKIVNQNKKKRPLIEKMVISLARVVDFEKLLNYKKRQEKYVKIISRYDVTEEFSGNYTGAYKLREIVPSTYFGEGKYLMFEDIRVRVPSKYESYLTAIYGENYMELPPKEERIPHQYKIEYL